MLPLSWFILFFLPVVTNGVLSNLRFASPIMVVVSLLPGVNDTRSLLQAPGYDLIPTPSKSILSASRLSNHDLVPTPSKTAPSPSGPPSPVPGSLPHPRLPHGQHTTIATSPHPPVATVTIPDTPLVAVAVTVPDTPLFTIAVSHTTLTMANSSTVATNLGFIKEKGWKVYGYVEVAGEYCSEVVGSYGGVAGGLEVVWVAWGNATNTLLASAKDSLPSFATVRDDILPQCFIAIGSGVRIVTLVLRCMVTALVFLYGFLANRQRLDLLSNRRGIKIGEHVWESFPPILGPWAVGPCLGQGATAVVHRVVNLHDGTFGAMKIIDKTDFDTDQLSKLYTEIIILSAMRHPSIVKILDVVHTPERLCIVTELMEGGDLSNHVLVDNSTVLPHRLVRRWFLKVFTAVEHMHHFGLYHRDLKLENILFSCPGGVVKVADFGLSSFRRPFTITNECCGTPDYLSPELYKIYKNKSQEQYYYSLATADVWALGVILFTLIAGELAFKHIEHFVNRVLAIKKTDPEQITAGEVEVEVPEGLPRELQDLLMRMLCANEGGRITMQEIRQHPWITQGRPLPPALHTRLDLFQHPIRFGSHPEILEQMKLLLGSLMSAERLAGQPGPNSTWEMRLYALLLRASMKRDFKIEIPRLPADQPDSDIAIWRSARELRARRRWAEREEEQGEEEQGEEEQGEEEFLENGRRRGGPDKLRKRQRR